MTILLWDTETTGLPFYGAAHPSDAPYQPRMCSIDMALLTTEGEVTDRFAALVKPEGWPLDNELFMNNFKQASEKAHGLTIERLWEEGVPIADIHQRWQDFYTSAEKVCGFNVWFDHKVTRGEWKRLGAEIPFRDKEGICLMKCATDVCAIERKQPGGGYKFPKLGEAVKILLGKEHDKAHTASGDVDVSIELYRHLYNRGLIVSELQPEAKNKEAA